MKRAVSQKARGFSHTSVQLDPPNRTASWPETKYHKIWSGSPHRFFQKLCLQDEYRNTSLSFWRQPKAGHTTHCCPLHSSWHQIVCIRHDERAVWAHLEPILKELRASCPEITVLHVISDGPVTQYRNRANFYLLSTVPFLSGFKHVTWNYSEKSHGKGAPDGIGGAVKRDADRYVQRGGELQTPLDLYEMLAKKIRVNYYSPLGKRREHSEIW